jgi:SAM-dependent methyltransferase
MDEPQLLWQRGEVVEAYDRAWRGRRLATSSVDFALFELAAVAPGMRVLDVGAGTGDTALEAARLVGPAGRVLAVDISSGMAAALRRHAATAGLINLDVAVADAPDASFDAAIARHSIMFMADPNRALATIRRVVRPGGRFAASVWSSLDRNPYLASPKQVLRDLGLEEPALASPSHSARLSIPVAIREAFAGAGFVDIEVRRVEMLIRAPSASDAVAMLLDSLSVSQTLGKLPDSIRESGYALLRERWRQYEGPDGFRLPGEALVAAGTAPGSVE